MWKYLAESVVGSSHSRSNTPCQDHCLVTPLTSSDGEIVLVAACSDGAGSAQLSHLGSEAICLTAVKLVDDYLQNGGMLYDVNVELAQEWLIRLQSALSSLAQERSISVRELACTLLLAIIGTTRSIFLQIGDGAIVVHDGAQYSTIFWPQNGEYANTTNFATDERASHFLQFHTQGTINTIAVFSDGLQMLLLNYKDKIPFAPFFDQTLASLRHAPNTDDLQVPFRGLLSSQMINDRTDDDKTLILAVRAVSAQNPTEATS